MSDTDLAVDPQIEIRARNMGWVPETEWDEERAAREGRQKPLKFKTAEEWVRDTEASVPMMRGQIRAMSDELTALKDKAAEVDSLKSKLDDTGRLAEHLLESQRRSNQAAYDRGILDAEARMKQAVKEGDEAAYDEAKADRDRLDAERVQEFEAEAPPPPQRQEQQRQQEDTPEARRQAARSRLDPETRSWVEANGWFDNDIVLNGAMIEELGMVKTEMPGVSVTEGLEEAKRRVVEKFPRKFGINPAREAPSSVRQPSGGPTRTKNRTFADIPAADQESYRRQQRFMKERGVEWTDDEIVASHQWDN